MAKHLLRGYLLILILCVGYCTVCGVIMEMANCQVDHHNPQRARQLTQTLSKIAPGYPSVFAYQGWREYDLENYAQAMVLGQRALARDPKDLVALRLLGQLEYIEEHYEKALEYWECDLDPATELGRGWAYWGLGRFAEARQSLKKCPSNAEGLEELRREDYRLRLPAQLRVD
ncbi:hypothetical protein IV102_25040 [bacterium]|nr:hypothetical protein [bacterium]